ncbi:MAG TPA: phosphonate metabolism transcriptional regulator PhnF [Albitalea sp.]|nr:phosphonate metabolism transcriptional regulator PhnF [Albitalea sp.]
MLKDASTMAAETAADAPGAARWETIAATLRDEIVRGCFKPGERLPNELLLAERFAVNRHTLRQAMQALLHEGHVSIRQGRGTFVRELVLDYALQRRTRLSENLASMGERAERRVLEHRWCEAGRWAEALRVPARAPVAELTTLACVRGRPVGLSTAAFPCPRLHDMAAAVERAGSVTRALHALGVADYTRARSVVSTRLPTPQEADWLARAATQPVLVVHYVNVDPAGAPVEAGSTLFAGDAVQLTIEPDDASP